MESGKIFTFDEYEKLDEGVKDSISKFAAGALLAAGLHGNATAGGDPKYNHADHKADTVSSTYSPKEKEKYASQRAFKTFNDYKGYENEHTHKVLPYYSFKDKDFDFLSSYTGRYSKKFNEDFFFGMSDNNYTNLGRGFASKALIAANDRCANGKYDIDDPTLNFKIIKRPGTKAGVALNDALGIAVNIQNVDNFLSKLSEYYIVTPIGDSYGPDDEIFKDKKDCIEWFNISPSPKARRIAIKQ